MARAPAGEPPRVTVVDEPFVSTVLRDNRIGLNPERAIKVLLPPGYAKSKQRYPVVYFLHNAWWGPRQMIEDGRAQRLIERGFADGVVQGVHLRGRRLHRAHDRQPVRELARERAVDRLHRG